MPKKAVKNIENETNFVSRSFNVEAIKFGEKDGGREGFVKKMDEIKAKYDFIAEFELLAHIDDRLGSWFIIYRDINKITPRNSQIKKFLEKINKAIDKVIKSTSELDSLISRAGIKITSIISEYIASENEKVKEQVIKDFQDEIDNAQAAADKKWEKSSEDDMAFFLASLPYENVLWKVKSDLENFSDRRYRHLVNLKFACEKIIENLSVDIGGVNEGSDIKSLIKLLCPVYEMGTGKRAICNYNDAKGCYQGEFYDFLLDFFELFPRLDPPLPSYKPGTIGENAREILRNRRKVNNKKS